MLSSRNRTSQRAPETRVIRGPVKMFKATIRGVYRPDDFEARSEHLQPRARGRAEHVQSVLNAILGSACVTLGPLLVCPPSNHISQTWIVESEENVTSFFRVDTEGHKAILDAVQFSGYSQISTQMESLTLRPNPETGIFLEVSEDYVRKSDLAAEVAKCLREFLDSASLGVKPTRDRDESPVRKSDNH